jgi:hypothetical protein
MRIDDASSATEYWVVLQSCVCWTASSSTAGSAAYSTLPSEWFAGEEVQLCISLLADFSGSLKLAACHRAVIHDK